MLSINDAFFPFYEKKGQSPSIFIQFALAYFWLFQSKYFQFERVYFQILFKNLAFACGRIESFFAQVAVFTGHSPGVVNFQISLSSTL